MPVPRINIPKYKKTERSKMTDIVIQLNRMGYCVDNARDAIQKLCIYWINLANIKWCNTIFVFE